MGCFHEWSVPYSEPEVAEVKITAEQALHYYDNLLPIVRQMEGPMWGAAIDYIDWLHAELATARKWLGHSDPWEHDLPREEAVIGRGEDRK